MTRFPLFSSIRRKRQIDGMFSKNIFTKVIYIWNVLELESNGVTAGSDISMYDSSLEI